MKRERFQRERDITESLELGTGRLEETEVRMTFDLGEPVAAGGFA